MNDLILINCLHEAGYSIIINHNHFAYPEQILPFEINFVSSLTWGQSVGDWYKTGKG